LSTDIRLLLREAHGALMRRDFARARGACEQALAQDRASADAWNLLGLIEHHAGRPAQARAALEQAVAVNPRYLNAWKNLAAVSESAGDHAASAHALEQVVRAQPRAGAADWYNLGVRAFRAGRLALAGEAFETALARRPDDANALNNLACVRDAENRPYEARALAERLLALAPETSQARHTFSAVFSKATEPSDLARGLEQALKLVALEPAHAGALDCAAIMFGKLGDAEQALAHARRAVAAAPALPIYTATLVRLLEQFGRVDEAVAVLAERLPLLPSDATLARLEATVKLERGDPLGAEAALERALALAPADQASIALLGLALQLQGKEEAAATLLGLDRFIASVELTAPPPFCDIAAFNCALAEDIRGHSRLRYEPVGLAAKGGYLTEDLLADRTEAILGFERALRRAIDAYVAALPHDAAHPFLRLNPSRYRLNLWATRVAAQGVIDTHIHDASWLSGAYYVELPPALGAGEDRSGWIEFGRPHRGLPAPPESALRSIRPAAGMLLLFPSYLYHRTLPFAGEGERISISFDLTPEAGA
jgi:uncharacterized protein (TIGR02466 family)